MNYNKRNIKLQRDYLMSKQRYIDLKLRQNGGGDNDDSNIEAERVRLKELERVRLGEQLKNDAAKLEHEKEVEAKLKKKQEKAAEEAAEAAKKAVAAKAELEELKEEKKN